AAFLPGKVELEIRVGYRDRPEALERQGAHERPAQVGVEHHALRVDDRTQRERTGSPRALHDARREDLRRRRRGPPREDSGPLLPERLPDERGQPGARASADLRLVREPTEELIDRGQASERGGAVR